MNGSNFEIIYLMKTTKQRMTHPFRRWNVCDDNCCCWWWWSGVGGVRFLNKRRRRIDFIDDDDDRDGTEDWKDESTERHRWAKNGILTTSWNYDVQH